ncbi:MAG TPA: Holliday junction resolvase RuvX [Streptosporangiaceae bacterium]|nr:Holliday junction resolvase RuvX [Streptosporangiaceae bacterium]
MRAGKRLAIDVGSVRIGVASCDQGGVLATPLATVRRGRGDLDEISRLCGEHAAIEVIVGLPITLAGKAGTAAADARSFASALAARVAPVPVRLMDERFTTTLAHSALRAGGRDGRDRRRCVDKAAAAMLLQSALDSERLSGDPAGELVTTSGGAQ